MKLCYGTPEEIEKWMELVFRVRWNFPGLEAQEALNEHRATVLKFMGKRQAVCVKEEEEIAGVLLFSRGHNQICCLAVAPEYRRRGGRFPAYGGSIGQFGQDKGNHCLYLPSRR